MKIRNSFPNLFVLQKAVCSVSLGFGVNGVHASTTAWAVVSDGGSRAGPVSCPETRLKKQKRSAHLRLRVESAGWRKSVQKVILNVHANSRISPTFSWSSFNPLLFPHQASLYHFCFVATHTTHINWNTRSKHCHYRELKWFHD